MNYLDTKAKEIHTATGTSQKFEDVALLYRSYALLAFSKGKETTLKDVHDAWAVWRSETQPDHKDLVPFEKLDEKTQEYDRKYMNAIHSVC